MSGLIVSDFSFEDFLDLALYPPKSAIKYIEKLDWVIGTGEYIKDAKKELQYRLLKRFEKRRYGDDQYFWIHNTNYKLLMHPYRSSQVGKNDENLTDNKEQKIVKLFVNGAKKKENPGKNKEKYLL